MERTILHVDMDAFYVSVELRRRPDLVGQPVVVGGTGNRGVVAAASYEARRYDVHSALPSAVARRRCPHAVFLPGDHELYTEVSRDVHEIFGRYTPLIEPLSLDEAFLDVSGATRLFGEGVEIARRIRADVRGELELGCSVGVAPNKFLAKLASVEAKPRARPDRIEPGRGVVEVVPGAELDFLHPLPVKRLWGVGPVTLEKLRGLGVKTVGDLARLDERTVVSALGQASGTHLLALSRALDDRPVEVDRDPKSIGHEETYPHDLHDVADLDRELVRLSDAVSSRLRRHGAGARTLTLKVRFAGFRTVTRSTTLDSPVDTGPELVTALGPLLHALDVSPGVRLLGVSTSNFGAPSQQLSLLDEPAESGNTAEAIDEIRDRFGTTAIGPASSISPRGLRVVRKGAQQWGPDQQPKPDGNEQENRRSR
ncbi:DNA polymerase IV [Ilumatobacter sp.]|uniref:DNA polymerase IV n=1 Tax=Ilumatobacter sp. TaxID=1967498 RepID=UPI003AF76798